MEEDPLKETAEQNSKITLADFLEDFYTDKENNVND